MQLLDHLFGVQEFTTRTRIFDDEPSQRLFQDLFNASRKTCGARVAVWDEVALPRRLASVVSDESPSPAVAPNAKAQRSSPLIHLKASKVLSGYTLEDNRASGQLDASAVREIEDELAGLWKTLQASMEYVSINALLGSINTANIEGSDVSVTLTYGVGTRNGGAWTNNTTKILSTEFPNLVDAFVAQAGRAPGMQIIGTGVEGNLILNDEVRAWGQQQYGSLAIFNSPASPEVLNGAPLGGFQWRKSLGGYVPTGGSFTKFMPNLKIITLPMKDQLSDVFQMHYGFGLIPVKAYGEGTPEAAKTYRRASAPGPYAYTVGTSDPAGLKLHVGCRFFPVIKDPRQVLVTTVT